MRPHSPSHGYSGNALGFRSSTSTISDPNEYPSSRRSENKYRYFHKKGIYAMDGDPNAFESSNGCGKYYKSKKCLNQLELFLHYCIALYFSTTLHPVCSVI